MCCGSQDELEHAGVVLYGINFVDEGSDDAVECSMAAALELLMQFCK